MKGIKPYIGFGGNCREAFDFYRDALGGEIIGMLTYAESGQGDGEMADKIMHAVFTFGDTVVMAADDPSASAADGGNVSLAVGVDNIDDAERMFAKMSEGGNVTMPLQETFWAAGFGMLTDKFGIKWMFNCEKPHGGKTE